MTGIYHNFYNNKDGEKWSLFVKFLEKCHRNAMMQILYYLEANGAIKG